MELGNARAMVAFRQDRWTRWRTYYMLTKRMAENPKAFVADYDQMGFWLRSVRRIAEMPIDPAGWRSGWPGKGNIWEWNTQHFGIALTWGLTHTDALKGGHWTDDVPSSAEPSADGDAAPVVPVVLLPAEVSRQVTHQRSGLSEAEMFEAERAASARASANA